MTLAALIGISGNNSFHDLSMLGRAGRQAGWIGLAINIGQVMGPVTHLDHDFT